MVNIMDSIKNYLDIIDDVQLTPEVGDFVELEFGDIIIESTIEKIVDDGIILNIDDTGIALILEEAENKKSEIIAEAEYRGRKVPLGKRMRGDVKKFKVYVKGPKGNVVKVNFGDPNMRIKKSNPKRRKSFRARHNCATAKDRTTARYWSCRSW
jgi:hypothetical protein